MSAGGRNNYETKCSHWAEGGLRAGPGVAQWGPPPSREGVPEKGRSN